MKMSVDTVGLGSILQRLTGDEQASSPSDPDLHFAQCVNNEVASLLPSVNITGVGAISIPISKKSIFKIKNEERKKTPNIQLKKSSDSNLNANSQLFPYVAAIDVERDSCSSLERSLCHVAVLVLNKMVGFRIAGVNEVGLQLNRLTVCLAGGHFSPIHPEPTNKPGTIGKLMLQLPVHGGYEGGMLSIDSSSYDFSSGSKKQFYCAAFISTFNVPYDWQPIDHGCMAILDFCLIWCPNFMMTPLNCVPALWRVIRDFKEIEESLKAWNTNDLQPNETEEIASGFATHLLVLPLSEDYDESYFEFPALCGSDVALVRYLQSIEFLDVHLVIIDQKLNKNSRGQASLNFENNGGSPLQNRSSKIHRWIYSSSSLPQMQNYQLDYPKQFVGDIKTVLHSNEPRMPLTNHQPALVIQPRHQSIRQCGLINFDILLTYLQSRMKVDLENSELIRLDCLICLGHVLKFCEENPLHVWDVEQAETRTRRLLAICKTLRAKEEGIKLISLLAKDFPKEESEIEFYEGVRSELVARDIVEMLWINHGWNVFSTQVLQLIKSSRLQNQMINVCQIALSLLDYDCIERAKSVAHQIFSSLYTDSQLFEKLNQMQINAFINVIIAIETHPANDGSTFKKWVIPLISKMNAQQRFQILIDLEKNQCSLAIFKKMSLLVLEVQSLFQLDIQQSNMIRELSDCFLQHSDQELHEKFIRYALWCMPHDFIFVFNKASSTITGKTALLNVLEKECTELKTTLNQSPCANELSNISKKLSYLSFIFVLVEDNNPNLTKIDSILSRFFQLYDLLPTDMLDSVITFLMEPRSISSSLSSQSNSKIFKHLEESIISRESSSFGKEPPFEALFKLLKYFADQSNSSTSLSRVLLDICEKCRWGANDKILLIKKILEFQHIWNSLAASDDECDVLKSLLKTWIDCICQVMNNFESDAYVKDCYIYSNILECVLLYIRKTKSGFIATPGLELFFPLLEKMPVRKIGRIMSDIYQSDVKEPPPNLKMFQLTRDLYLELCKKFVMGDLSSVFRLPGGVFVLRFECLLWTEDEELIQTFTDKILEFRALNPSNTILEKINSSIRIRKMTSVYPRSNSAVCFVLEKWLGFVNQLIEKQIAIAWQIPHISFPGHPVVEEFLRTPAKQMIYANFINKDQAVKFSSHLSSLTGSFRNCSIDVKVVGDGFKCRCEISKMSNCSQEDKEKSPLETEKDYVEKMLETLKKQKFNDESASVLPNVRDDDDVVELPLPKKRKPDIIDLD